MKQFRKNLRDSLQIGAMMFINYGLIAFSYRMLSMGSYVGVAVSDALVAWWGFTMVKRIHKAETFWEQVGYTIGGVCGSLTGLWLTKG